MMRWARRRWDWLHGSAGEGSFLRMWEYQGAGRRRPVLAYSVTYRCRAAFQLSGDLSRSHSLVEQCSHRSQVCLLAKAPVIASLLEDSLLCPVAGRYLRRPLGSALGEPCADLVHAGQGRGVGEAGRYSETAADQQWRAVEMGRQPGSGLRFLQPPQGRAHYGYLYPDRRRGDPVRSEDRRVKRTFRAAEAYRVNFWDGLILAAAGECNASSVWTEDLSHGQRHGSVEVRNPFV